jgi:hypothetical protein
MDKLLMVFGIALILLLIDYYLFDSTKKIRRSWPEAIRKVTIILFWAISFIAIASLFGFNYAPNEGVMNGMRRFFLVFLFLNIFPKILALPFLMVDDIVRIIKWTNKVIHKSEEKHLEGKKIKRSEFLVKAAIIAGGVPLAIMSYGIVSGAYNYRIIRRKLVIPNLPKEFHGINLAQISDIHAGSFFNKRAVAGGIEMLMGEKPDLIFFTGDLVNTQTDEVNKYFDIFNKVKAPLGTYSILGNHDYGDYRSWASADAKRKNLLDMIEAHKLLGWDLLLNENRTLELGGEKISIIGVENWGAGRFTKYGDIVKATQNINESSVKLLLSHDPSHWDAQIRPDYSDIDVMFAGHTHGFQFGVELGNFKWSPAQYAYKQWADLYQKGNQKLYVNRGFGFIGYPGRIGIAPEITVFELVNS